MSTYNDNLRTTVKTTLAGIGAEEQKRKSVLTVAHYNLYYAVGTQIRAEDMRNNANDHYEQTWCINHQGVNCSNRANNLLTTATNANKNITATVTNTATAATNVQVAANAVLKVAAGMGSANNMVNASDYDTDIQRMTGYANEVMVVKSNNSGGNGYVGLGTAAPSSHLHVKGDDPDMQKIMKEEEEWIEGMYRQRKVFVLLFVCLSVCLFPTALKQSPAQ